MGRRSKIEDLTDDDKARIVLLLRNGSPQNAACGSIGIDYDTLLDWRKKAKAGDARYVDFIAQVDEARDLLKCELLAKIKQAGSDDWKALAWILERLFPKEFAQLQKLSDPEGAPLAAGAPVPVMILPAKEVEDFVPPPPPEPAPDDA